MSNLSGPRTETFAHALETIGHGDEDVAAAATSALEPINPVVFFDALRVKIRNEATVRSNAVYLALGGSATP